MRANIPRSFRQLSPSGKARIEQLKSQEINRTAMIMLDIFLKMSCSVLHDAFGFGEQRLTRYLGNYRRLFSRHKKMVREGTQLAELDAKMQRIFKRSGYPDEFFRMMFADWDIQTTGEEKI